MSTAEYQFERIFGERPTLVQTCNVEVDTVHVFDHLEMQADIDKHHAATQIKIAWASNITDPFSCTATTIRASCVL